METESDYPYKAADGMCHFEKSKVVVNINGSLNISSDEDRKLRARIWNQMPYFVFSEMAAWLASNGPITIGINAAAMQVNFDSIAVCRELSAVCVIQHYHGGIADPWTIFCRPSQIDHGVLIVGYGQGTVKRQEGR